MSNEFRFYMSDRDDEVGSDDSFVTAVAPVSTRLRYVCDRCGALTDEPFGIYDFRRNAIIRHLCEDCIP